MVSERLSLWVMWSGGRARRAVGSAESGLWFVPSQCWRQAKVSVSLWLWFVWLRACRDRDAEMMWWWDYRTLPRLFATLRLFGGRAGLERQLGSRRRRIDWSSYCKGLPAGGEVSLVVMHQQVLSPHTVTDTQASTRGQPLFLFMIEVFRSLFPWIFEGRRTRKQMRWLSSALNG